jgi:hypothetical protein
MRKDEFMKHYFKREADGWWWEIYTYWFHLEVGKIENGDTWLWVSFCGIRKSISLSVQVGPYVFGVGFDGGEPPAAK